MVKYQWNIQQHDDDNRIYRKGWQSQLKKKKTLFNTTKTYPDLKSLMQGRKRTEKFTVKNNSK